MNKIRPVKKIAKCIYGHPAELKRVSSCASSGVDGFRVECRKYCWKGSVGVTKLAATNAWNAVMIRGGLDD